MANKAQIDQMSLKDAEAKLRNIRSTQHMGNADQKMIIWLEERIDKLKKTETSKPKEIPRVPGGRSTFGKEGKLPKPRMK